jgi:hypothetical protein
MGGKNNKTEQKKENKAQTKDNPGEGEIFRTRPERPWDPPSLVYNGVSRPGCGVERPTRSGAEVKERVELYLYSPSLSLHGLF